MIVESWYEIYSEGNKGKGLGMMRIPRLKNTLQSSHGSGGKSKGKLRKCCEIAVSGGSVCDIGGLGDPTVLIAGVVGSVVGSLMSK
ncbi:hypothetical protein K1719_026024 [Acacia pycnantha]|nr:hypothetical protein K1719_026024 [Acacia pycnantha]